MKILAIRGEYLASFDGPFEIDFTSGVLAAAGLFAICGPTGAGKSTLLDAMCLALFGKTPRLSGERDSTRGQKRQARERAGQESAIQDDLSATDARQLLRKGAGRGFAECDFVGVGGKRYRARWDVRRARNRGDGRMLAAEQTLSPLDDDAPAISGKSADVLAEIKSRLGLDFEQFRRSSLLAQGEFAAFLRASGKERASLLERVTGSEIYSKLSVACFEKQREVAAGLEQLQQQLAAIAFLSPEEQAVAAAELQKSKEEIVVADARRPVLEAAIAWHRVAATQQAAFDQAKQQAELARAGFDALANERQQVEKWQNIKLHGHGLRELQLESGKVDEKQAIAKQQLQQREEAANNLKHIAQLEQSARGKHAAAVARYEEAKPKLVPALAAKTQVERMRGELVHHRAQAQQVDSELQTTIAAISQGQQQLDTLQSQLLRCTAQLAGFDDLRELERDEALVVERLQTLVATVAQRDEVRGRSRQREQEIKGVAAIREKLASEVQQATKAENELRQRIEELQRSLSAIDRQVLTARLEVLRECYAWLTELDQLCGEQAQAQARCQQLQLDVQQQESQLVQARGLQSQLVEQANLARAQVNGALLAGRALAKAPSFEQAREDLVHGESCPLCGATEHPWASATTVNAAVASYQHETARLQKNADEQQERAHAQVEVVAKLVAEIASKQRTIAQEQQLTERQHGKMLEVVARLDGHRGELEAIGLSEQTQSSLLEASSRQLGKQRVEVVGKELRAQRDLLDSDSAALQKLLREQAEVVQKLEIAKTSLHQAVLQEQRLSDAQHAAVQELAGKEALENELRGYLLQMLALRPALASALQLEPASVAASLRELLVQAANARTQHARIEQELAQARQRFDRLGVQREGQKAELDRMQAALARQQTALDEQIAIIRACVGDEDPQILQESLESQLQTAARELEATRLQRETIEREAMRMATLLEATNLELAGLISQHASRRAQLQTELATIEITLEDAIEVMQRRDALEALAQTCNAAQKQLENHERELARIGHEVQQHGQSQPELALDLAQTQLFALQTARDTAIAQVTSLQEKLVRDAAARQSCESLRAELEKKRGAAETWQRLASLIAHSTGDRFRNFAQGLAFDALIAHANFHLGQLDRRYRLEKIPGSMLELQIVDMALADEVRSIHSLSGGETFLVSLALALGLSTMSASNQPVESLFIDEGFGTLDRESLERAMSALEALQAGGRKVGIISHVEGLAEQIGVVIDIRPAGAGRSRLTVRELGV